MENTITSKIRTILELNEDESELMNQLRRQVDEYEFDSGLTKESKTISELYKENLKAALGPPEDNNIIKSGFTDLDNMIGGFLPGEFVVLGELACMGVNLFQINLALNISKTVPVQFFVFKYSANYITRKFMAALSGIQQSGIRLDYLIEADKQKLLSLESEMTSRKIFINDNCINSLLSLKKHCLQQIKNHGVKVIFVDFIQLMSTERDRKKREHEISYISRELKNFARENDVCIIAASYLSKDAEKRALKGKMPQLSDLKKFGSLEQEADKVIFLYRHSYYMIRKDKDGNKIGEKTTLIIAKNRSGPCDNVWISRIYGYSSFTDYNEARNIVK